MSGFTISSRTALASTAVDPLLDVLYIVDTSVPEGKKIAVASLQDVKTLQRAYAVTISNSLVETDMFNYTIPAGLLGTNRAIKFLMFGTMLINSGTPTLTMRLYLGGTTLIAKTSAAITLDADTFAWKLEGLLANNNLATSQVSYMQGQTSNRGTATGTGTGELTIPATALVYETPMIGAAGAVDTTIAQTFRMTMQIGTSASASNTITKQLSLLELV